MSAFSIRRQMALVVPGERALIDAKLDRISRLLAERFGLPGVRDDSRLAWAHASGQSDLPEERVVEHIAQASFLYNNTDYQYVTRKVLDVISSDLYDRRGLDMDAAQRLVIRLVLPAIKAFYQAPCAPA